MLNGNRSPLNLVIIKIKKYKQEPTKNYIIKSHKATCVSEFPYYYIKNANSGTF